MPTLTTHNFERIRCFEIASKNRRATLRNGGFLPMRLQNFRLCHLNYHSRDLTHRQRWPVLSSLDSLQSIMNSRYMDKTRALDAFAALSQPTRLDVFRLLIKAGAVGMSAGEIGATLEVRQNTMSANLSILAKSGLIRSVREGRHIRYFADIDGLRGLLAFLMEECCGGRPEVCQPIIDELAHPC